MKKKKIGIQVLGCDKNTVDSEYLAGLLHKKGVNVSLVEGSVEKYDAIVVFSCGFINEARRESISAIQSLVSQRDSLTRRPRIIVAGCMPQVFLSELQRKFPDVDAFVGIVDINTLVRIIQAVAQEKISTPITYIHSAPEVRIDRPIKRRPLQRRHYSFLRIADGCDHRCTFCIIPKIKGHYRSVPREVLIAEAEQLVSKGIKEINVIAQDITRYGEDIYGSEYGLVELLKQLANIPGEFWIRLLYCYPTRITGELIKLIANEPKICPYLDIPLQHLDEDILRAMGRPYSWERTKKLIRRLRRAIPDITVRSTFIVGFPGETEERFQRLKQRLQELTLGRVGFFLYSDEKGTKANALPGKVPRRIARRRLNELARLQAGIARSIHQRWVGSIKEVLVEAHFPRTKLYLGRSQSEAPEIDGFICFTSSRRLKPGDKVNVHIDRADAYELFGHIV
ncbi:30S ribosomal protein S12 methylthiotransferase RimO [Candidatus Sumerlaeota bacterium]|nr:30S ribosomal protein S12 methylthiotransferase RimO [Candidatus Sumerlaeota bacterium]